MNVKYKKTKSKIDKYNKYIAKISNLITTCSSQIEIFLNLNEFLTEQFTLSFFTIYNFEDNFLKCLTKKIKKYFFIQSKIYFENDELNKILSLRKIIDEKDEDYDFLFKKMKLPADLFYIFIPVVYMDNFCGMIIAGRDKKFSEKEKKDIFLIGTIIAPIVFIGKNLDEKRHIEALMVITNAIVEKNNLDDTLKIIVNVVAEVMDYKICSIMLYDEEKQELVIKATQSLSQEYKLKPNLKIGQSLSGMAIKEKRPITTIDVTKDPHYRYPEIAKKEGLKSMLAVPMILKDKKIGVINVYTNIEHNFSQDEIKILTSVANLAAVAIYNAKLEEETIKTRNALEARKLIERAKGILMKLYNLSEEDAYTAMRKKAMDMCKPLKDIAEAIILSNEIKKK